ncbi:MAG: 16S rRNA (cytosine(1402)-N(4))-methyltransferase RsmH [Cyanobacteriota bacterium]|nr:16S rRNA (cytosine(1402)-N(4))-methyltransferase RsmH [Cyanobacteriota bacterium]
MSSNLLQGSALLFEHLPVLCEDVVAGLAIKTHGSYLDATVGGGGHSLALLRAGIGRLIALDHDREALAAAQASIQGWLTTQPPPHPQVRFHHLNFSQFCLAQHGWIEREGDSPLLDGILADLGVSSPQLDRGERGFSFRQTGPLDMRMNPEGQPLTAADLLNHADEATLVDWFSRYGEERYSKRIARQLVAKRPWQTTTQLADAIVQAIPPAARHGRIHPATRVFQALRMVVNQELEVLQSFLAEAVDWLKPGGRIAVISFHSLEDRLVKWQFRRDPRWQIITAKPIQASPGELANNPRARSAKLRIAQRRDPSDLLDSPAISPQEV